MISFQPRTVEPRPKRKNLDFCHFNILTFHLQEGDETNVFFRSYQFFLLVDSPNSYDDSMFPNDERKERVNDVRFWPTRK